VTVRRPDLWWPNGAGDQPLYQARVTLATQDEQRLDQRTITFGIRRVELLPNEAGEPRFGRAADSGGGRAPGPEEGLGYTLVVNGMRLFARGWNWVPHDQLYGRPAPERYERL